MPTSIVKIIFIITSGALHGPDAGDPGRLQGYLSAAAEEV
jgi:hypothetical protein